MTDVGVIVYSVADSEIAILKDLYSGLEATTPVGYEAVRVAIGDLRTKRVDIETHRVVLKSDALTWGRKVDAEAKRLTAALEEIEEELKRKKLAVDAEKERKRREAEAAKRAALMAQVKAERDAEEAHQKALRDEEDARLASERQRLAEERAQQDSERAKALEELATKRAEQDAIDAQQHAQREALDAEQRALQAQQEALEQQERNRLAAQKAQQDADALQARLAAEAARLAEQKKVDDAARTARIEALKPDVKKVETLVKDLVLIVIPKLKSAKAQKELLEIARRLEGVQRDVRVLVERMKRAI